MWGEIVMSECLREGESIGRERETNPKQQKRATHAHIQLATDGRMEIVAHRLSLATISRRTDGVDIVDPYYQIQEVLFLFFSINGKRRELI